MGVKGVGVQGVFGRRPGGAGAALTVAVALALGLVVLTALVATGRTDGLDHGVNDALPVRGGGPALLYAVARAVTTVASPPLTMGALLTVVVVWALWSRSVWPVVAAVPAVGALGVSVLLGKWLLARPGPPGSDLVHHLGWYPSGHTATALVCTGTLAVLVSQRHPQHRRALFLVVAGWTALVGWGMVWLHFHWLCDVLGAILLGALLLLLIYQWPWHVVAPTRHHALEAEPVGRD